MPDYSQRDLTRFWSHVPSDLPDDTCWPWGASKTKGGYGQIMMGGRMAYAHRVMAGLHMGPTPVVDHTCKRRDCVNPQHLRSSGAAENAENMNNGNPFMGVYINRGRVCAEVMCEGVRYRRSNFATREDARDWARFVRWHMKPLDEVNNKTLQDIPVPPLEDLFPAPKRGRRGRVPNKSKREEMRY